MVKVTNLVENEDGSADIEFEVNDREELKTMAAEGLNFMLLKAALGGTTSDIIRWSERGKKEERTDILVSEFGEICNEDTK